VIIIAVNCKFKGGVGKSTNTVGLGAAAANMGLSVLLADIDPQVQLTTWMGIKLGKSQPNLYRVMDEYLDGVANSEPLSGDDLTALTSSALVERENFYVLPGSRRLDELEEATKRLKRPERLLSTMLRSVESNFDLCLLDCPPLVQWLNNQVFVASDWLVIPFKMGYPELNGVVDTIKDVADAQATISPQLNIAGVLPGFVELRRGQPYSVSKDVLTQAATNQYISPYMMSSYIPYDNVYRQLPSLGSSPFGVGRGKEARNAANAYVHAAAELLLATGSFTERQMSEMVNQALISTTSPEVMNYAHAQA